MYKTHQITPDNIIAGIVEIYIFAAPEVDRLSEGLLFNAVNLEHGAAGDDNLDYQTRKI